MLSCLLTGRFRLQCGDSVCHRCTLELLILPADERFCVTCKDAVPRRPIRNKLAQQLLIVTSFPRRNSICQFNLDAVEALIERKYT